MYRVEAVYEYNYNDEHKRIVKYYNYKFKREALKKYEELLAEEKNVTVVAYEWHYIM